MTQDDDIDWVKLIGGGFCYMRAPFALHPTDRQRAQIYLNEAKARGLSVENALEHAKTYLRKSSDIAPDEEKQLERVRKFFEGKLP